MSGVFLALHSDGTLWAVKTSGDLTLTVEKDKNTVLLASRLSAIDYQGSVEALPGWYKFDKNGRFIKHQKKKNYYSVNFTRPHHVSVHPCHYQHFVGVDMD
jgi:hypothetical protein